MSLKLRLTAALFLTAAFAPLALGYIHFPPMTLPKMCKTSTDIRVVTVKKLDKEKGIVVFETTDALKKGEDGPVRKATTFRHVIRPDAEGVKPIFQWLAEGKTAVMFTIEGGNIACGYVFIDEFCYSIDYNTRGDYWALLRPDPQMAACYFGSVEKLQSLTKDLLTGKDVMVPTKDLKPLTKEEIKKRADEVNEVMIPNRGLKK